MPTKLQLVIAVLTGAFVGLSLEDNLGWAVLLGLGITITTLVWIDNRTNGWWF